jgi:hypothetical protein
VAGASPNATTVGASTLYGTVGAGFSFKSGCFGLPKKPFKNRNIMFSYVVFNKLVTIH